MTYNPKGFLPGARGSFYDRVQATPPVRFVEVPPAAPAPVVPPAPALLSVAYSKDGGAPRCTLSKPLLAVVPHLKAGGRVLLVAPIAKGGRWYLYTRPAEGSGSKIPERGPAVFRTHPIARGLFMRPNPTTARPKGRPNNGLVGISVENVFNPTLRFVLGSEVPASPGCYELVRVA